MRVAVITPCAGRSGHLHRQRLGLAAQRDAPALHVVVGMGEDPELLAVPGAPPVHTVRLDVGPDGLPVAAARNAGARLALDAGADLLVFLDVDCVPEPGLVHHYARAAVAADAVPVLRCGPVHYLPPPPPGGYPTAGLAALADPHPARPAPPPGVDLDDDRMDLFWSLSFATTADEWRRLGGFDERYVGYGAEDTDFAVRAASAGAMLRWVGGAQACHQYHPPARHTPERTAEIVRNATLFHARHGRWPMRGWLDDLAATGAVEFDPRRGRLRLARFAPPVVPGNPTA